VKNKEKKKKEREKKAVSSCKREKGGKYYKKIQLK